MLLGVNESLIKACGDYGLASILNIVKKVMGIIQIVVPLVMLVSATYIFIKMIMNPDEKKNMKALFNCLAAGVIVFFIPFIVNLTMAWLDDSFNVTACWNVADDAANIVEWYDDQGSSTSTSKKDKNIPGNKTEDYHISSSE